MPGERLQGRRWSGWLGPSRHEPERLRRRLAARLRRGIGSADLRLPGGRGHPPVPRASGREAPPPRRGGGVIRLSGGLRVASPYLTVAGQSAPGDGIALNLNNHACGNRVFDLDAGVHDVVIRYLRVWGDYTSNPDPSSCPGSSAVTMWGGSYGVVMDHITALWHSGEAFSQWADQGTSANNGQATVSWSLFGENTMGGSGNPQSTAAIVADSNYDPGTILDFDFHHNVIASTDHRVPLVNGRGRFINNVVQNWVRA